MNRAAAIGVALALSACVSMAADITTDWSGAYERSFDNGNTEGDRYQTTDYLLISPIDENSAFVEIGLNFFNGHECSTEGVFRIEGDLLVYREPASEVPEYRGQCVLSIGHDADGIGFTDENGNCRDTCGARGGYDGAVFPLSSRRLLNDQEHARLSRQIELLHQSQQR